MLIDLADLDECRGDEVVVGVEGRTGVESGWQRGRGGNGGDPGARIGALE